MSAVTVRSWLKQHRPKHALCPHMLDYCDTCKQYHEENKRKQATKRRLHESGSATSSEIEAVETEIEDLDRNLSSHKTEASNARAFYNSMTARCSKEWERIVELSATDRTPVQDEELEGAKHNFTLVLSADYQQSKLIPHWGHTAQQGQTYYYQKVSHDVFGVVDHKEGKSTVYIFSEEIGLKNTDHTISLLSQYLTGVQLAFPWIRRICLFLDNAGSTNKSKFFSAGVWRLWSPSYSTMCMWPF